jgi:hypothetical protein
MAMARFVFVSHSAANPTVPPVATAHERCDHQSTPFAITSRPFFTALVNSS